MVVASDERFPSRYRYREAWRLWQRVRQCVSTPEYDAWKYPDAFDEYHFSHSPALLKRLVG